MSQLNIGFEKLNDTDFLQKGREIVNALTTVPGSGYFASVMPTPASLATALDTYEATLLLGNAPGAASDRGGGAQCHAGDHAGDGGGD